MLKIKLKLRNPLINTLLVLLRASPDAPRLTSTLMSLQLRVDSGEFVEHEHSFLQELLAAVGALSISTHHLLQSRVEQLITTWIKTLPPDLQLKFESPGLNELKDRDHIETRVSPDSAIDLQEDLSSKVDSAISDYLSPVHSIDSNQTLSFSNIIELQDSVAIKKENIQIYTNKTDENDGCYSKVGTHPNIVKSLPERRSTIIKLSLKPLSFPSSPAIGLGKGKGSVQANVVKSPTSHSSLSPVGIGLGKSRAYPLQTSNISVPSTPINIGLGKSRAYPLQPSGSTPTVFPAGAGKGSLYMKNTLTTRLSGRNSPLLADSTSFDSFAPRSRDIYSLIPSSRPLSRCESTTTIRYGTVTRSGESSGQVIFDTETDDNEPEVLSRTASSRRSALARELLALKGDSTPRSRSSYARSVPASGHTLATWNDEEDDFDDSSVRATRAHERSHHREALARLPPKPKRLHIRTSRSNEIPEPTSPTGSHSAFDSDSDSASTEHNFMPDFSQIDMPRKRQRKEGRRCQICGVSLKSKPDLCRSCASQESKSGMLILVDIPPSKPTCARLIPYPEWKAKAHPQPTEYTPAQKARYLSHCLSTMCESQLAAMLLYLPRHVLRDFTGCLKRGEECLVDVKEIGSDSWVEIVRICQSAEG